MLTMKKKNDVLLFAGNKHTITSRFCLQLCSELLNDEKSTFLDSYNQFWFNNFYFKCVLDLSLYYFIRIST